MALTDDTILLAHGSGGCMAHQLVHEAFVQPLSNPMLSELQDAATFKGRGTLAFTTDSYVVHPIFFPGGDIGRLAVCGTVNDLATAGAAPLYLSLSVIIEEGFTMSELGRIVSSIREACDEAQVDVVTGDTKVVNKGSADRLFINTAGIGAVPEGVNLSTQDIRPGDAILLSGAIGDHGMAVMSVREGLGFSSSLHSDCAPLCELVSRLLKANVGVRSMRDPTRGGLATVLNELASSSGTRIEIEEASILVHDEVQAACELLGLDPLYVANEGKMVAVVPPDQVDRALSSMRSHPHGSDARRIGTVTDGDPGRVVMRTAIGSKRIIGMLTGDVLPRIC